jgi:hypothetical protein
VAAEEGFWEHGEWELQISTQSIIRVPADTVT